MRGRALAVATLAAAPLLALAAAPAVADAAPTYHHGERPVLLPLVPGTTGGTVLGGRGDHLLLGAVTKSDGTNLPAEWRGSGARWTVTDLSSRGRLTGQAESIDRHGDILIFDAAVLRAWVVTPDGTAHRLRGFGGPSSGVYARQMNLRGEIAGAVFGPAPEYVPVGAVWPNYAAAPRRLHPLPFPGSVDAVALGINDEGATVGNSDNASFSDFAGGEWPRGSSHGFRLPGLGGSRHSFPVRINDYNVAVGDAGNADWSVDGAAVWVGRRLHFLGTAIPSDTSADLYGLSNSGRAVGVSRSADFSSGRLIYWRGLPSRTLRILSPLTGTWRTGLANAHYVSNDGLVGGNSSDASKRDQPVVWPDADAESFIPDRT